MRQLIETLLRVADRKLSGIIALDQVVVELAIHRRRFAGTALIDQQDVTIAANVFKRPRVRGVKLHAALAGAARNRHQWIGFRRQVKRGYNRNAQRDTARNAAARVQRPGERAAARFHTRAAGAGTDTAILKLQCLGGCRAGNADGGD